MAVMKCDMSHQLKFLRLDLQSYGDRILDACQSTGTEKSGGIGQQSWTENSIGQQSWTENSNGSGAFVWFTGTLKDESGLLRSSKGPDRI